MSSIISAGTTVGTSLSLTGDTSGELQIQTNNGATTAMTLTTGGAAVFTAGTVSAPAITTTGDTNTGIFFPAADTIAFTEGGVEAMRIDSSGNVGIGTTAGFSDGSGVEIQRAGVATLRCDNSTASSAGEFRADGTGTAIDCRGLETFRVLTGGAERMRIDSSGNVGIGTSSPSVAAGLGLVLNGAGSQTRLAFKNTYTGDASTDGVQFALVNGTSEFIFQNRESDGTFAWETNGTERMRIDSSGNVTVGTANAGGTSGVGVAIVPSANGVRAVSAATTNASETYSMYSTGAAAYRFYVDWSGKVNATNTTIAAISDQRLKENVQDIDVGLTQILALKPRKFDWKAGKGKDIKNDRGWIAQEFEQVFPDMVGTWKDTPPAGEEPYKSVAADLIPVLVKAIQELKAELDSVKAELQTLKGN